MRSTEVASSVTVTLHLATKPPDTVSTLITAVPATAPGVKTQLKPSAVIVPISAPLSMLQITEPSMTFAGVSVAISSTELPEVRVSALVLLRDTLVTSLGWPDA